MRKNLKKLPQQLIFKPVKYITVLLLLISTFTRAQFFEQNPTEEPETSQNQFFQDTNPNPYPEPEYGNDVGPGGPGDPTPIDDWAFLLPLAGLAVGVYFIRKKKMVNE